MEPIVANTNVFTYYQTWKTSGKLLRLFYVPLGSWKRFVQCTLSTSVHPSAIYNQRRERFSSVLQTYTFINRSCNHFFKIIHIILIYGGITLKQWSPKSKKIENLSTTYKFFFNLGPKRYLGPRDPILEVCVMWGVYTYSSGYEFLSCR